MEKICDNITVFVCELFSWRLDIKYHNNNNNKNIRVFFLSWRFCNVYKISSSHLLVAFFCCMALEHSFLHKSLAGSIPCYIVHFTWSLLTISSQKYSVTRFCHLFCSILFVLAFTRPPARILINTQGTDSVT